MEKLNFEQILDILKTKLDSIDTFAYEDYDHNSLGLGEIKQVDRYGGEGKGDIWYSVKYFKDHDIYIKVSGYYSSYNGTEFYDNWNCCKEVKPKEKLITIYE